MTNTQSPFELAVDVHCTTGESPVWVGSRDELIFVDIPGKLLYRYQLPAAGGGAGGNLWTMDIAEDIGCVAAAHGGGYVAGLRTGIWLLDETGAKVRRLAENPEDHASSRFNDGRVDPRGRYFSGTLDELKVDGRAGLYRCDRRGLQKLADRLDDDERTRVLPGRADDVLLRHAAVCNLSMRLRSADR